MDYQKKKATSRKEAVSRRIAKSGTNAGNPIKHPKRDYAEEAKYQADPALVNHREETNRYNRRRGTYGNHDHKDASATGVRGKIKGLESEKTNRSRKSRD